MEEVRFSIGEMDLNSRSLLGFSDNSKAVFLADKQVERVDSFRRVVETVLLGDKSYYGINTGFGFLAEVKISKKDLVNLQYNLVRSHACGVGELLSDDMSRSLLFLRAHTLAKGNSGISVTCIKKIIELLKKDCLPCVPVQGSVGASGDLAPLAHLAQVLIGEGEVSLAGERIPTAQAFKRMEIQPYKLREKEGLSLINGTCFMANIGAHAVQKANGMLFFANKISALSLIATRSQVSAFSKDIHLCRNHLGQIKVAEHIRKILDIETNESSSWEPLRVQDPYSFRCIAQVHGASFEVIDHVRKVIDRELNAVTDNPLVFEDGRILSGGNFHGQALAFALDYLALGVCELASLSERRIEKMTSIRGKEDLPPFLIRESGLNSGFMIPHVVSAALVSENKILAHPASVDSIPTSAGQEDHVSMGPIAGCKSLKILENTANVLAIELLCACQAIDILNFESKLPETLSSMYAKIRSMSEFLTSDRSLSLDIKKIQTYLLESSCKVEW
jgi:histidine ammonia-lyase